MKQSDHNNCYRIDVTYVHGLGYGKKLTRHTHVDGLSEGAAKLHYDVLYVMKKYGAKTISEFADISSLVYADIGTLAAKQGVNLDNNTIYENLAMVRSSYFGKDLTIACNKVFFEIKKISVHRIDLVPQPTDVTDEFINKHYTLKDLLIKSNTIASEVLNVVRVMVPEKSDINLKTMAV